MREWLERKLEKNLVPMGYVYSVLGTFATLAATRVDHVLLQGLAAERGAVLTLGGIAMMVAGLQRGEAAIVSSPEPTPEGGLSLVPLEEIELAEAA